MTLSPAVARYAVVANDGGTVVNIIEAVEGFVVEGEVLVADDGTARIGGVWDGVSFLPPEPAPPPVPNANHVNLVQNIERLGLDVDRILPLHSRVVPMSELLAAVGRR